MSFGPIMRFTVPKSGLKIELAPLTSESVQENISYEHGGGMQRHSVTRYLGMNTVPTAEDEQEWFDMVRKDPNKLAWGIWMLEADRRMLIGVSSLDHIGQSGHVKFIRQATSGSQVFRPEYWGKGIVSAAHKARAWYAFNQLGLCRINSAVIQDNVGSAKALGRSGYTYTHTDRNEQFSDGKLHHIDYFECLNPLDQFWSIWWGDDEPTTESVAARKLTQRAMAWADKNVDLL